MGFNPVKFVKKTVKKAAKEIINFTASVVQKAVSWVIDTPDIPDYGSGEHDEYEKGVLVNKQSNDAYIPVIYGERLVGGTRVFLETSGTDNTYLYMAIVMAEGEINSIEEVRIDDKVVTWASSLSDGTEVEVGSGDSNFYKSGESLIRIEPHFGTDGQSASSLLSTLSSWGSNHKLSGLCYLALRFKWNQDAFGSIPKVQAKIKGKKVVSYNSSLVAQTASYSTNPAWCLLDYLTNTRYGKGLLTSEINLQSFYDASVVCETQVEPYSGASNINIFDTNAVIDTSRKLIENVREIIKGCRGYLPYTSGKYKLIIETTGTATITLNEDDIIGGYSLTSREKSERYNRVIVNFVNPDRNFQVDEVQFPPIDDSGLPSADQHSTMKTADGGILLEGRFDFKTITSPYQAEEMAEIILRRSRQALTLVINVSFDAYDLAIGDIVNITHSSLGFSSKAFRVVALSFSEDYTIGLNLIEHQDSYYTWANKTQVATTPTTNLPNPFSTIDLTEAFGATPFVTDEIIEYNDGVIITKMKIVLSDLSLFTDSFFDYYEVEISEDGGLTYNQVGSGKNTVFEVLNVKDDTTYNVRARYVNTAGVRSNYVSVDHTVVGQSAPPSNVQNFSINVVGDQAVLSWDAVTDLDLAYYVIKHSPNTTGATWINSKNVINKIARPATSASVPFQTGTYLIKAEDKRGNQSILETLIVSNISTVNYVFETTINEHTAFSGSKSNVEVVVKDSVNHIGLTATGTLGDPNSSVPSSGTYDFANTITLPAKFKTKFDSTVVQTIENVAEYIDTGRPNSSTLIDSGTPDPFDGRTAQNSNTTLQIATSDDNVTFSSFQNFTTGEFEGRYFKFRALLTSADQDSRTLVNTLSVTASLPERTESGADISSGTGGKTITFNNAFRLNPAITISGQNMATGDFFTITSKSTSAFTVEFFNSSGTSKNVEFDFQAKGVGQVIP